MPFGGRSIRPISAARAKLNGAFVKALSEDFEVHGVTAIAKAREKDPIAYLRIIVALAPMQIYIGDEEGTGGQRELIDEVNSLLVQKGEKPLTGRRVNGS